MLDVGRSVLWAIALLYRHSIESIERMHVSKLILRGLRFYWRAHLGVVLGAAVSTAVLVGALAAGDSVRHSLLQLVTTRLGRVEFAMGTSDRFFRAALSDDLARAAEADVVPVLQSPGTAVRADGSRRANRVQVLGVDSRFWLLGPSPQDGSDIGPDEALVGDALAIKLGLTAGDEIVVRVEKPGIVPRDMPVSSDKDLSAAMRLKVKAVVPDAGFGRFSLRAEQVAPLNVYVPLAFLSQRLDVEGRANLLLAARRNEALTDERLDAVFQQNWQLADAQLELRELPASKAIELRSSRLFLEPATAEAARHDHPEAQEILTYFVNSLQAGGKTTPYSFVSAPGEPLVPTNMADDQIIVNEWAAEDLGISVGDPLELSYYVINSGRRLEERSATFKVRSVVPLQGAAADRDLMPLLPGLSDAGSCRDWDSGIPLDLSKVRPKDEEYWNQYGGTPKAFVTLAAGRKLWENRFGALTAIRYPSQPLAAVSNDIRRGLSPGALGFVFRPVRQAGLRAAGQSVDFGQLFIGLSGFMVIAALIVMGLLFAFSVEQRSEESGTLLALGYSRWEVRRLLLAEGLVLAVVGGLLGTAGGVAYNHVILYGLGTVWRGAVGVLPLEPHVRAGTLVTGLVSGIVVAVLAMLMVVRNQASQSIHELQSRSRQAPRGVLVRRSWISISLALVCLCAALASVAIAGPGHGKDAAAAFFGAGVLMLVGSLAACHAVLLRMARRESAGHLRLAAIGRRNAVRSPGRSLATIGLLACGIFVVFAVGANRQEAGTDSRRRDSGTGGFTFVGETSVPVVQDLNSEKDRRQLGLAGPEMDGVRFVPIRVREGDDASCLNLNRAQNLRILGVKPEDLADRKAFTFAQVSAGAAARANPWLLLNDSGQAVADQTVVEWGLGKTIGDAQAYVDERGSVKAVRLAAGLAASLFQGSLLISERSFVADFPSASGFRMFLVDVPPGREAAVETLLRRALEDFGLDLTPTTRRLAEFMAVENTYLAIFMALGGLGLLLGSVGLGIVVLRNVQERRRELAMLRAVGYSRRELQRLVLAEHLFLLAAGVISGVVSALVAMGPALMRPAANVPWTFLSAILVLLVVSGIAWVVVAAAWSTRGDPLPALRSE